LMSEDEEGFQLDHGCSVLFDLFHNCSCTAKKIYFNFNFCSPPPPPKKIAVKGRFKDYYRFGKVRSCMPYWNDFFLCLRLKMETDHQIAQVN
jgi:hypothetical protein